MGKDVTSAGLRLSDVLTLLIHFFMFSFHPILHFFYSSLFSRILGIITLSFCSLIDRLPCAGRGTGSRVDLFGQRCGTAAMVARSYALMSDWLKMHNGSFFFF